MRILLCSNWFAPSFGGVETVSKILSEQFTQAGHDVTVVTESTGPSAAEMGLPYAVVRKPSQVTLFNIASRSDALLQNLLSLRTLTPLLLTGKRVVVTHQSWLRRNDGKLGPENRLKRLALRLCHNLSISQSIAETLPIASEVIGNPFEADQFTRSPGVSRDRDIVFMGRLVSDKGVDILLQALFELKGRGLEPTVTIIGDGPEMLNLRRMVEQFHLDRQVEFTGAMREGRGKALAQHHIMAIPSVWAEPFGIVALEGVASGCAVVASSDGGLPEAGGACGVYFPNRDAKKLAQRLEQLLTNTHLRNRLIAAGPEHLKRFQPSTIAARYIEIFHELRR